MKKEFKTFAKFLLLAQTASDAGKDFVSTKSHNAKNAIEQNYGLKDKYIRQAISHAKALGNVSIGIDADNSMSVVLFDIKGYGQVAFHTFSNFSHIRDEGVNWNGIRGGSIMTCQKIAKKLNLPFYGHKK